MDGVLRAHYGDKSSVGDSDASVAPNTGGADSADDDDETPGRYIAMIVARCDQVFKVDL